MDLPYPYNQDLSGVLRGLNRKTPHSKDQLANDLATKSYLAAAMRLLERELGPKPSRRPLDSRHEDSIGRPLLSLLSQRVVAAEVANNPDPFLKQGSTGALRSTWKSHSDFIADVLRFGLWSQHYLGAHAEHIAEATEQLVEGPDFIEAVHAVCYYDLLTLIGMTGFRLQLLATASAEGDKVLNDAMTEGYREILDVWQQVHITTLDSRGLRLRPDVSIDDIGDLLTAAVEGLAVRALADRNANMMDHARHRSLFGKFALALLAGCMERRDEATGLSLKETVHSMIYGVSADPGSNGAPTSGAEGASGES